jgi:hypothetical protein
MNIYEVLGYEEQTIKYPGSQQPILKGSKPTNILLGDWPLEKRIDKFFEFCRAYDVREEPLLKQNPQQFSHRLHWDEMPYVYEMRHEKNLKTLLHHTIVWSFSNEHWQTFRTLRDDGIDAMRARFQTQRHARSDLFQIYYPKDTKVKDWLADVPQQIAEDCWHLLDGDRPLHMMELASKLEKHTKEKYGFRNVMYPYKNLSRHIAMARPDLVDPETWVTPGTLSFYGLWQIFGGKNLFGKTVFELKDTGEYVPVNEQAIELVRQFDVLAKHPNNPMQRQYNINIEDKACMFCKHLFISHGIKGTTKQIPYDWVYPTDFDLTTGIWKTAGKSESQINIA